jgi:polyisoprenyl-teichoic acid--peptidoglycan teichoic acid transferase
MLEIKKMNIGSGVRTQSQQKVAKRTQKSRNYKKLLPLFIIVSVLVVLSLLWSLFFSSSSVAKFVYSSLSGGHTLRSSDDRVNILLLGMAGGNHDGAYLTDSIIVASYNLKTKEIVMFSIPRDLWLENIKDKVNAAYEKGEFDDKNGIKFAEDKIDDIMGLPIHYGIRIDFAGFAKAINLVGGVDVDVPHTFDDYEYPITGKERDLCGYSEKEFDVTPDLAKELNIATSPAKQKFFVAPDGKVATGSAEFTCRYEHIQFSKGKVSLDGETALKFVRSRHGTNGEGSDFARSRRQQLVIDAFRRKVMSIPTLLNPQKIAELLVTFNKSIETDIPAEDYLLFINLAQEMQGTRSVVLGALENGTSLFYNPPVSGEYYGAWVLIPKDKDYGKISSFVKQTLESSGSATLK